MVYQTCCIFWDTWYNFKALVIEISLQLSKSNLPFLAFAVGYQQRVVLNFTVKLKAYKTHTTAGNHQSLRGLAKKLKIYLLSIISDLQILPITSNSIRVTKVFCQPNLKNTYFVRNFQPTYDDCLPALLNSEIFYCFKKKLLMKNKACHS